MPQPVEILIFGASYGALMGIKLALAGHNAHLICFPRSAEIINRDGVRVRMPVRGHERPVEIDSRSLGGSLTAGSPQSIDIERFDLVVLAMQEPQYRAPEIHALLQQVAGQRKPCVSIMNMPPLAYLRRIPELDCDALRPCYTDAAVWDAFDPDAITLCSPDPQAFRPPGESRNVLQVTLPTNFKAARFGSEENTAVLRRLEHDIATTPFDSEKGPVILPVKLRIHESLFVPMAKWSMLLTGNYRCIQPHGMRSISEAVHSNPDEAAGIYRWVAGLCMEMGAAEDDLVPFEKYAAAAKGLSKPSSAARALANGALFIERVDLLVKSVAAQFGRHNDALNHIVDTVNAHLDANRQKNDAGS